MYKKLWEGKEKSKKTKAKAKQKKLCNISLHFLRVWYKHDWKTAYTVQAKVASRGVKSGEKTNI